MDRIRARYQALNSKGGGSNYWKPKDGETDIRILPPPAKIRLLISSFIIM